MTKKSGLDLDDLGEFDPALMARQSVAANLGGSAKPFEARQTAFFVNEKKVPVRAFRLKPEEMVLWQGNGRSYGELTFEACEDLIESMDKENGNRVAVVVRERKEAAEGEPGFELLVGSRRHWAASWLNTYRGRDISLLAVVDNVADAQAFVLADLENRARTDISDFERAVNYRHAVEAYFGGSTTELVTRLGLSKTTFYRVMQVLELPPKIVAAFDKPTSVTGKQAATLLPVLKTKLGMSQMLQEAEAIATEQSFLAATDKPAIPAKDVTTRLLAAARKQPAKRIGDDCTIRVAAGTEIGKVVRDHVRWGLTVEVMPDPNLGLDAILDAVRNVIVSSKAWQSRS